MEKLIIEGHVTNENKVFKLFIKHFEYRDTRHVIYDLLISLNDGQAADWVTYCDKICIKHRTTSVPSGAILEYAFTVYDLSNPSEYAPDTAMDRINQSKLSAFSDIVLAIVKAYDSNCNNADADEGNQEDRYRYTITIDNCWKDLYKGSLNSDIDFSNITKYITKNIIHDALEKFREYLRVTVVDNILGKTYGFCVCDENSAIGYSAFKTNIRFIDFVNNFIKYKDSDFAAKRMITRFCAIVMQIAGAIENNYGLPNNKDADEAKLVYEEEEETDAIPEEKPIQFNAMHGSTSEESISYCCYLMPDDTVRYSIDNANFNCVDDCNLSCSIIKAFSMFSYATVDVGKVKFCNNGTEYSHAAFTLWDRFSGKVTAEYMVLSLKDRFNNFCKRLKNDADDCDEMNEVILRFANAFIRNLHEAEEKMEPSPFDHFDILRNHMNILQDYSSGFDTRADYAIMGLVISDRTNYDHELTDKDNIVGMHNAFTNATNLSFCSANNIHKCYAISTCAMLYVYYDKRNIGPIYLWGGPNDESLTTFMNRLYVFAARDNNDIPVPCMYNIMVYCRAFITDFIQGAANANTLCKGARKEILDIIRTLEISDCL